MSQIEFSYVKLRANQLKQPIFRAMNTAGQLWHPSCQSLSYILQNTCLAVGNVPSIFWEEKHGKTIRTLLINLQYNRNYVEWFQNFSRQYMQIIANQLGAPNHFERSNTSIFEFYWILSYGPKVQQHSTEIHPMQTQLNMFLGQLVESDMQKDVCFHLFQTFQDFVPKKNIRRPDSPYLRLPCPFQVAFPSALPQSPGLTAERKEPVKMVKRPECFGTLEWYYDEYRNDWNTQT